MKRLNASVHFVINWNIQLKQINFCIYCTIFKTAATFISDQHLFFISSSYKKSLHTEINCWRRIQYADKSLSCFVVCVHSAHCSKIQERYCQEFYFKVVSEDPCMNCSFSVVANAQAKHWMDSLTSLTHIQTRALLHATLLEMLEAKEYFQEKSNPVICWY